MNHLAATRADGLLASQWSGYREVHRNRKNLLLHVATAPLFMAGTLGVLAAPFISGWLALAGIVSMLVAVAVQGRGHRLEEAAPKPFRGPVDVLGRLFAEQWITFPRYVMSGELIRALRADR